MDNILTFNYEFDDIEFDKYIRCFNDKKEKVDIHMEYEGMVAIEVLENVRDILKGNVIKTKEVIRQATLRVAGVENMISNIDEYIDSVEYEEESFTPEMCLHNNRIIIADDKSETVSCDDCGLMLSYKLY